MGQVYPKICPTSLLNRKLELSISVAICLDIQRHSLLVDKIEFYCQFLGGNTLHDTPSLSSLNEEIKPLVLSSLSKASLFMLLSSFGRFSLSAISLYGPPNSFNRSTISSSSEVSWIIVVANLNLLSCNVDLLMISISVFSSNVNDGWFSTISMEAFAIAVDE